MNLPRHPLLQDQAAAIDDCLPLDYLSPVERNEPRSPADHHRCYLPGIPVFQSGRGANINHNSVIRLEIMPENK